MLRSKSSGISLIYPRSFPGNRIALCRASEVALRILFGCSSEAKSAEVALRLHLCCIYDARIEKKGRTNRRNTGKTSVDRSTKATLTLTIPGCN